MPTEEKTVKYHALTQVLQGETSAESEILLPDYYPSIMKLIHTDSSVLVRSRSVRGDKAYVDGAVEFRILYLSDGNDGFHSVFYQVPFSYSTDLHSAEPDTAQIRTAARLTYVNTRALSPQKLYAKAVVALTLFVFEPAEIEKTDDATLSGLITKAKDETVSDILLSPTKLIRLSEEISPGANVHPAQILRYEVSFSEPEKKNVHTKTIVKSELKIKVYYTVENDSSVLNTAATVPFSQVLETPENVSEDMTFVRLSLSDCHLTVKEKSQDNSVIDMDAEVSVSADCFVNETVKIVTDAFSTTNDLSLTSRDMSFQTVLPLSVPFEIRDTLSVEEDKRVVDVCADTDLVASCYNPTTKTADLACKTVCHLLCENALGEYSDTPRELTFTCIVPVAKPCDELFADVDFRFSSFDIFPGEHGAELRASGLCTGVAMLREHCTRVTDISVSEKQSRKTPCFVAYRAQEEESVWEIAKRYSADPNDIKRTNDIVGDTTDGKKMIFIRR